MDQQNSNQNKPNNLSWSTPAQNQNQNQQKPNQNQQQQKPVAPKQGTLQPTNGGSNMPKYVGMIVLGIIVGVLGAWAISAMRSGSVASNATSTPATSTNVTATTSIPVATNNKGNLTVTTPTKTTTSPATNSGSSLGVPSPQPAGKTVTISSVKVPAPTWVVVYENNAGKPGNALGATLFFPESQKGSISLLRATVAGKTYLVGKQLDNGDRKFSLHGDAAVTENGAVQLTTFTAN